MATMDGERVGPGGRERRAMARGGPAQLPLAFVILCLLALIALPVLGIRRSIAAQRLFERTTEPARAMVTQLHSAMALGDDALLDYLDVGDTASLGRYRRAAADEREAMDSLEPLMPAMGAASRARFRELRTAVDEWHAHADAAVRARTRNPGAARFLLAEHDRFERALVAASELDRSLSTVARARRLDVLSAERGEVAMSVVLGLLALAAVLVVAHLGRRLHAYAQAAEAGRRRVEELMEGKARLIRGITHDLKNPLGAIDGHAQLLEDGIRGPLTSAQTESVRRMRRSARAMLAIIGDMLELSKAEAGQLRIDAAPADLSALVREAVEEHRGGVEAAGLTLELEDGALPPVRTDAARVAQVLGNLLSNAVKYTPAGGRVLVRAEACDGGATVPRAAVAIHVSDDGPGIPPEKRETVFEEFSRLEPERAAGVGLGLAISRRIARLMGGDLTVGETGGGGSTFTLWLPDEPPTAPAARGRE
ncbi:MAG TPA: HAMP domain-containing sensor histidine kinase [Longimicrobiaceae bacterium]|jgi:signal transduction histidine kinase|nr:HAMP domain-containing sensor histidine kinase [Longimicrobiaceae bacterium]